MRASAGRRDPAFDMAAFARAYAIMGAQRATKVLGIFARLDKRDGKPQYLRAPAADRSLSRAQSRRIRCLSRLEAWYETHLPRLVPARS